MGSIDLTSDTPVSGAFKEPPLQEVAQPVWKERKSLLREWTAAFLIAFLTALIIRAFFFEAFRIPSESMENTLLVGDFVLVSKLHYGPRVPVTIGVPFTNLYLDNVQLPSSRFPGFTRVERGDVIVFNVPSETAPVDRKTHYIKRVVGLPGDSLSIVGKVPVVNGLPEEHKQEVKHMWKAYPVEGKEIPVQRLKQMGIYQIIQPQRRGGAIKFEATVSASNRISEWDEIERVEAVVRSSHFRDRIFPPNSAYSLDNYGPIHIPKKGDVITLSNANWDLYREVINRHELNQGVKVADNTFRINGEVTRYYTIKQDYYFVMGDNRDSSLDSRTWGFVPASHLVGKALFVYFSWDPINGETRTDRILKKIQ